MSEKHNVFMSCRRDFLLWAGASAAALAIPRRLAAQETAARKPNILVILADDLGYAELGAQGCRDIPTPHTDSIARNGVRMTQGYVSCPVCAPTRAGLLTGRYQQRFGFETNPGPEEQAAENFGLPRTELTIAERLKPLGYATGAVGKWHVGYKPELTPTQRGFDEFFGFLGGANSYFAAKRRGAILRGKDPVEENEYLTDAFGREAAAFIERHHAEPFFLYLPFNAVHSPLEATEQDLGRFTGIADSKRRTYAGMTAAMDNAIGRVIEAVRRFRLEEDTLIIFLSDNGGPTPQTTSSNLPLRGYKAQVYEGGIRIPFMVQWKGRVPAGKVYDRPAISLDILPTAIAAAGGEVSPEWKLDGVNLLPYLRGENASPPHDALYWRIQQQRAIRQGDWKLVKGRADTTWALYNLAEDLSEKNDLAGKMPDKVKGLDAAWQAWNAQLMEPRWVRQTGRTQRRKGGAGAGKRGGGVEQRFKEFDRNGDGKLTPDEVPRAETFKQMDKNADGVVTKEEAKDFYSAGRRRGGAEQ